jgi:peptide/nickel transport system ATP-binding protein
MAGVTGAAQAPLLEVRGLGMNFPIGKKFRPHYVHAVTDASFTLAAGEAMSLVGESGSGKSTLARLISRLVTPTAGEIRLHGHDVLKTERRRPSRRYRSEVQMIFQDPYASLNPVHTIGYHVARPLKIHGHAKGAAQLRQRSAELLASVGLGQSGEMIDKYPHQLSGGQRQRVAIARALAVEPSLIVADEPVSSLDMSIRAGILTLMQKLKAERQIAYLYITHDLASARYMGDKTVVMYAGRMVEGGLSGEVTDRPAHPYTNLLLEAVPRAKAVRGRPAARAPVPVPVPVPDNAVTAAGCPFATRCPYVMDACRREMPPVHHLNATHWVRCHLSSGQGLASSA